MKRAQLYVSSIGEDCCESARDFGVGIELAQFCTAARLDGASLDEAAARAQEHCPRNEVYRAKLRVREMLENLGGED